MNIKSLFSTIISIAMGIAALFNPKMTPFVPGEIHNPQAPSVDMITLIENNSSPYVIVRGENAAPSEINAANTLRDYLQKISGFSLPIVTDSCTQTPYEVIVGKTNREGSSYGIDRAKLGDEGFNIKTCGQKLIIAGGVKRGTLYGVYTFLEEVLDCHWYTSTLIIIPSLERVRIPAALDIEQKPYLEYRETDWISPRDATYSIANKLNGNIYRSLSEEQGGTFGYTGSFAHTLTNWILPSSQYFAQHPEYYALTDSGKREPTQLCLTNPDVLRLVTEQVMSIIEANPDAKIISLTQHDNQDYCTCDNCRAVDEYEGSHSGTLIRFVNAVADAIKEKYPNVYIDTFAYQYTRKPPLHVVPRDNVIVRLCSIECCFSHPLNECKENESFCKDLQGWSNIAKKLYIWDYTTNYANYMGPFCDFGVLQENIQNFVQNKVVGIYEEGNYQASEVNVEFAELRSYLLAKLMWNPYLDYQAEMDGFLKAYYGEGWQYVKEFIMQTIKNTGTNSTHMHIFQNMNSKAVLNLTENEIKYINALWENAKALASTDEYLEHVQRSEICWRYWKACNHRDEFSWLRGINAVLKENEKLYYDIKAFGVTRLKESRLLSDNPNFWQVPSKWDAKS